MEINISDKRSIENKKAYDVIVVGGGIAGVSAAVSAARNGASTLLIEKQINLGGLATMGLISWYEPLCDGNGNQVIYGIAEELIKLSVKYGFENLPKRWGGEGENPNRYDRYATFYSPTIFSLALDEFVRDSGADIRFDTLATYPVVENGHCNGVVCESVSGREFYPCGCIIDATGDASVCAAAGLPLEVGTNYHVYVSHAYFRKDLDDYQKTNDVVKFRRWFSCGGDMYGNNQPSDLKPMNEYNSDSENEFIKWGKKRIFERINSASSKNDRDIMMLPTMPQYRKIRRLVGEATFDGTVLHYEDSIGKCGDFRKAGPVFEIPFGALYNKKVDNLLAAGRIISATGDGWEIIRVIPVCALTGEAAGIAAAICSNQECNINKLDIGELQKTLLKCNINIQ